MPLDGFVAFDLDGDEEGCDGDGFGLDCVVEEDCLVWFMIWFCFLC